LAALGGGSIRTEPYAGWPVHRQRDVEAVTRVVKSGKWGGYPYRGPELAAFLKEFLDMQEGEYAIAGVNGTVTMEIALRAAGIGRGD
jgi:dTDP-4-amino-4,6-dideoxygalactose transaminase